MAEEQTVLDSTPQPWSVLYNLRAVYIENREKVTTDISPNFLTCKLYEDLFTNTASGCATFKDESNLFKNLKLNGADRLVLIVGDGTETIPLEFLVFSHSYQKLNDTSEMVTLDFVSLPFVLSQNTRLWRAYKGSASEIVKSVFDELISNYNPTAVEDYVLENPKIECDQTEGVVKFVSPGWTPFALIAWLSGRSTSVDTGGSFFLFYQTLFDGFKFKSVESLIKQSQGQELDEDHIYYYSYAGAGNQKNNIKSIRVATLGDSVKNNTDLYTDLWMTDFTKKEITKRTYNANVSTQATLNDELVGILGSTNGFGVDFEAIRGKGNLPAKRKNESTLTHDSIDFVTGNALQRKMGFMRQLQSHKVIFENFANNFLKVGDVIELKLPQRRGVDKKDDEDTILDKELSGRYFVTAKALTFELDKVKMDVECLKDSILED